MKRRKFVEDILKIGALSNGYPLLAGHYDLHEYENITILHTNDQHSRIDPFPDDGGRNAGLGGASRRAALIKKIRKESSNVLLLDSGDIFQGTPYFNLYHGEVELKLMSEMGYDAATMGNHDFDAGIEGFYKQLPNANFPFICSNYNMENTIMNGQYLDFKIFEKGTVKVGIYGLGIELEGLVPMSLYGDTHYIDPISTALKYESILKNDYACDLVICLSHLGFQYRDSKVSDMHLAKNTLFTDIILGGHTHTFLSSPVKVKNANDDIVVINQVGFGGIYLGRIDIYFSHKRGKNVLLKKNYVVH